MHLTVVHPFTLPGDKEKVAQEFKRGDKIFHFEEIKAVLGGENARNVVRSADQMINGSVPQSADPKKLN